MLVSVANAANTNDFYICHPEARGIFE